MLHVGPHVLLYVYGVWLTAWSALAFCYYGWDKRQAQRGGRRVRETTLHRLDFLGGFPGAWCAQRFFHHKTHKASFQRVYWLAPALHVTLLAAYLYWRW